MNVSFIVLAWNSEKYLAKCYASIHDALEGTAIEYEVLFFDNGSSDGTDAVLAGLAAAHAERVRVHRAEVNLGTTKSRNILLAAARGRYVCVMDSDVELAPGVIEGLIAQMERHRDLGIVVPRINYPSGVWQKSFDRFPTLLDKANRLFRLRQIERREARDVEALRQPFFVDYAISAFWLMPRRLIDDIGAFDERIFYAPEDVDFCLRVWRAGLRILYVPTLAVVHHTQEISRGIKLSGAKLSHIAGLAYYFFKHRYVLRRPTFPVGPRSTE